MGQRGSLICASAAAAGSWRLPQGGRGFGCAYPGPGRPRAPTGRLEQGLGAGPIGLGSPSRADDPTPQPTFYHARRIGLRARRRADLSLTLDAPHGTAVPGDPHHSVRQADPTPTGHPGLGAVGLDRLPGCCRSGRPPRTRRRGWSAAEAEGRRPPRDALTLAGHSRGHRCLLGVPQTGTVTATVRGFGDRGSEAASGNCQAPPDVPWITVFRQPRLDGPVELRGAAVGRRLGTEAPSVHGRYRAPGERPRGEGLARRARRSEGSTGPQSAAIERLPAARGPGEPPSSHGASKACSSLGQGCAPGPSAPGDSAPE